MNVTVQGEVSPGFESVKDAFASNWQRIEVGASRCFPRIEFAATRPFELDVAENQVPSPPNCCRQHANHSFLRCRQQFGGEG